MWPEVNSHLFPGIVLHKALFRLVMINRNNNIAKQYTSGEQRERANKALRLHGDVLPDRLLAASSIYHRLYHCHISPSWPLLLE